jgi:RsiW-degrading membrane proteinase PrsW (M82 family)
LCIGSNACWFIFECKLTPNISYNVFCILRIVSKLFYRFRIESNASSTLCSIATISNDFPLPLSKMTILHIFIIPIQLLLPFKHKWSPKHHISLMVIVY